jgi:two-component system NtrC family response regulator
MKSGAYDYITKPFNRDGLRLTVAKALQFSAMKAENIDLRHELSDRTDFKAIVGNSAEMAKIFQIIEKVAPTEATVLITGESGTGKELVARSIHAKSNRTLAPFIAVNCSAIPRDLLESELFGHIKGAFTGAIKDRAGKFELADSGTIFLDEIGELPLQLQPKLLRTIQERVVEPVGGTEQKKLDLRIIAATNLDLSKAVNNGLFREDLYYRLAVIPLHLPPLRERRADIPLLLRHFCIKHGGADVRFDKTAITALAGYEWPGNVRELENLVERLLIMRSSNSLTLNDIPDKVRESSEIKHDGKIINLPDDGCSLEDLEREIVTEALNRNGWNQTAAARFLRIPRHTLIYRMEKYKIAEQAAPE